MYTFANRSLWGFTEFASYHIYIFNVVAFDAKVIDLGPQILTDFHTGPQIVLTSEISH